MQHFLNILDYSPEQLNQLLDRAVELKAEWQAGGNTPILKNKTLAMLFMKPSLRTRVSFEMGMQHLGGHALYLGPQEVGLGKRESIPDVIRVLSGYVDGVMARVFEHDHVVQLAAWGSVPVINGLSDYNHPCQALADMLTLKEHFGSLEGLTIAYVGDSNNVTRSLLFMTSKLGMHLNIASPAGYTLEEVDFDDAQQAANGEVRFTQTIDAIEAVSGVHAIYTDTWTSMGQEAEAAERRKVFPPYQVNADLLNHADAEAVVLHCLPAHRGEEITDDIADGQQSLLFPQAHNRLHAQKVVLAELLGGA